MGVTKVLTSFADVAKAPGLRCDTHYIIHHARWISFYEKVQSLEWVSLDSLVQDIRNGLNLGTEYYSIEATSFVYLSVSQISPYGFEQKKLNYLTEDVESLKNYYEVDDKTILITRSGTVGIAMGGDHPSLDPAMSYVPSGFVITAKIRPEVSLSPRALAGYLNLPQLQSLIVSLAAGGNQKNISQEVFKRIPVPLKILDKDHPLLKSINELDKVAYTFRQEREALTARIRETEEQMAKEFERKM